MTEPLYTFVKGKGWVIETILRSYTFKFTSGESFHFEDRKPKQGEVYECYSILEPRDTIVMMNHFGTIYARHSFREFGKTPPNKKFSPTLHYITVVLE